MNSTINQAYTLLDFQRNFFIRLKNQLDLTQATTSHKYVKDLIVLIKSSSITLDLIFRWCIEVLNANEMTNSLQEKALSNVTLSKTLLLKLSDIDLEYYTSDGTLADTVIMSDNEADELYFIKRSKAVH